MHYVNYGPMLSEFSSRSPSGLQGKRLVHEGVKDAKRWNPKRFFFRERADAGADPSKFSFLAFGVRDLFGAYKAEPLCAMAR